MLQFAKAITSGYFPLGGVGISSHIADVLNDAARPPFMHGYTYSSHPTGCAVALAMLDLMEREGFVEQARVKGERLLSGLQAALADHPNVGLLRGLGLMVGV
jgi:adenosylmethionine-8-amino-7-oxononanoate aminotransferase